MLECVRPLTNWMCSAVAVLMQEMARSLAVTATRMVLWIFS
jgi:hypothetical protein